MWYVAPKKVMCACSASCLILEPFDKAQTALASLSRASRAGDLEEEPGRFSGGMGVRRRGPTAGQVNTAGHVQLAMFLLGSVG